MLIAVAIIVTVLMIMISRTAMNTLYIRKEQSMIYINKPNTFQVMPNKPLEIF